MQRLTTEERDRLYGRIAKSFVENYDEILAGGLVEPLICLDLSDSKLPVPKEVIACDDKGEEGLFVDELSADLSDAEKGEGIEIAVSRTYEDPEDGTCRVDTIAIEELDDETLVRLEEFVRHHKGRHIDERIPQPDIDTIVNNTRSAIIDAISASFESEKAIDIAGCYMQEGAIVAARYTRLVRKDGKVFVECALRDITDDDLTEATENISVLTTNELYDIWKAIREKQ